MDAKQFREDLIDRFVTLVEETVDIIDGDPATVLFRGAEDLERLNIESFALKQAPDEGMRFAHHPERIGMFEVESSNVEAIAYEPVHEVLYVTFQGTAGTYLYFGVDNRTWDLFSNADSYGSHHHEHIKGEFPYLHVED
ncbi:MAG: KTSC domain-containing protein [Bradymonadaceae bacterium]